MKTRNTILLIFGCLWFFASQNSATAQEKPPKPIEVTVSILQNLNFGTFCYGDGSNQTVTVTPEGARTSTGIILISSNFSTGLYEIEALPGTLITILNGPDVYLEGSNGGNMTLHIGNSIPQSPFIATTSRTLLTIGGTLTVGDAEASPAGSYSGSFAINFIQE